MVRARLKSANSHRTFQKVGQLINFYQPSEPQSHLSSMLNSPKNKKQIQISTLKNQNLVEQRTIPKKKEAVILTQKALFVKKE